jgi:hypothetical protein
MPRPQPLVVGDNFGPPRPKDGPSLKPDHSNRPKSCLEIVRHGLGAPKAQDAGVKGEEGEHRSFLGKGTERRDLDRHKTSWTPHYTPVVAEQRAGQSGLAVGHGSEARP